MQIIIQTEEQGTTPRTFTNTEYAEYGGSYRAETTERRNSVDQAINDFDVPYVPIIGVLAGIAGVLLVIPHAGAFYRGFGEIAEKGLYGVGAGIAFFLIGLAFWGVGKLFYSGYWKHRERAAEFEIRRKAAEMQFVNQCAVNQGFQNETGSERQVRYQQARPAIGHVPEGQIIKIERRS